MLSTGHPDRQDTTPLHVHRRDWRPCPATFPPPLRPTKPISVWLFAFAEAVLRRETLATFVMRYPAEFPTLSGDALR